MKPLNWGTIGCGDVCERKSGPPLYLIDGNNLVAVMRRDGEKAADFARRHNVPRWYDTVDALLADDEINVIYVATPDAEHEAGTIAAAQAGKHVLVEKAMATDAAACQRMIDTCNDAGVLLGVAYYRRCYPIILEAQRLLNAGTIGTLQSMYLNDEFPLSHRLDLVHFFAGDAATVWSLPEPLPAGSHAEHGAMLHVLTQSGCEATTPAGWKEKLEPEIVQLVGERGEIVVDDLKAGKLTVTVDGKSRQQDFGPLRFMHWGLMQNFLDHYNGKAPLACDGVEGRKSTVILDIVEKLAADGEPVSVDYS